MSALERFIAYQAENVCHADEDARLEWECLIAEMQDENDKLRELVRHLYDYRELYFKTGIYPTDHGLTERRMRELRIEVGE